MNGLPLSSMIILGYAVEMYPKAGIVKIYHGCASNMFDRDIKHYFKHDFNKLASALGFSYESNDEKLFEELRDMVLAARYPVSIEDPEDNNMFADKINERNLKIRSEKKFAEMIELAERVLSHVKKIDEYFKLIYSINIDKDGYMTFCYVKNLLIRITYRPSTEFKIDINEVKRLIEEVSIKRNNDLLVLKYWDQASIYEDNGKRTSRIKESSYTSDTDLT